MLIDKIFLQEAGSFLVLLHMSVVGQISYCGQKFTCIRRISLPAASSPADQAKARMVWGQAEDSVSTHTESQPFVSLQNRDTEMSKPKEGIHRALYGVIFGSYLLIALSEGLTLHLQPQQQSTGDMTGRVFLSSSKDSLGMKA